MVNGNCKCQPFLADIACVYMFFSPKLTLLDPWVKYKEAFIFFWCRWRTWEWLQLYVAFWRKEKQFWGQASHLKLRGYGCSWWTFLHTVFCQGQFTAYWEGLVLIKKLNTSCIFLILSLACRMKSKIRNLCSGAPPSCSGKTIPNVYVLLGSCLALDSLKWWLSGCAGAPASCVVQTADRWLCPLWIFTTIFPYPYQMNGSVASSIFLFETWLEVQKMWVAGLGGNKHRSENTSAFGYSINWKQGALGTPANS